MLLSDFARPRGAKDKKPRKKRGSIQKNIVIGSVLGTAAGLTAAGGSNIVRKKVLERSKAGLKKQLDKLSGRATAKNKEIKKLFKEKSKAKKNPEKVKTLETKIDKLNKERESILAKEGEVSKRRGITTKKLEKLPEESKKRLTKYGKRGLGVGIAGGILMPSRNVERTKRRRGYYG